MAEITNGVAAWPRDGYFSGPMSPVPSRNPSSGKALSFDAIFAKVQVRFPTASAGSAPNGARWIAVEPHETFAVAVFLKADPDLSFGSLCCLSGIDLLKFPPSDKGGPVRDDLVCAYDLHSLEHGHELRVKVFAPRAQPVVPSVESVWGVAGFFEREIFDLLGVEFPGHHDLRRILTPQDWIGHPLRKDYVYPETYGGVELKREGQTFDSGPYK
jgi:NADH-quinone oxidoreductase subunit C